ncbi:hypothetical protein PR048_021884 [Dryococelus australis]|uniref:C2H2-type domain-containing protein n=1 Tax=Dryococelus australis TaxID=614101 RepID=A0ABQ9GZJ6_9NEOP|nr:hypothetical protein PR048_021884 [Dryococelus australis]
MFQLAYVRSGNSARKYVLGSESELSAPAASFTSQILYTAIASPVFPVVVGRKNAVVWQQLGFSEDALQAGKQLSLPSGEKKYHTSTRQRSAARKKLQSYGTQQNRGSQKRKTWCCTFSMRLNSSSEKRRREKPGLLWHSLISFMSSSRCSDSRETLRPPTMLRLRLGRALSVQNVECAGQAGTSAQNVQNTESADQDGTTHQQSRDQDDDDPQLAGIPKRKAQPLVVSDDEDEVTSNSTPSTMRPTPAQDIMKEKIAKLRVELDLTEIAKKSLVADVTEHEKARKLRRKIDGYEKKLKLKEKQRVYAMKHRENKKQKIIELCSKNPDAAKSLTPRAGPGRPRLEEEQSELLKAVVDLAMFGASTEERRRCEIVLTVHTLSELTDKLIELGFNISRSATYIRQLPRRTDTREAKRHVVTVPVKLSRPEADHHKAHQDQYFCVAFIRSLETVASVLGPHSVNFLSQDDKARVPIGLIAANKQAPLVMHVEYKVSLPDHDFVIASTHKLIPSVYALCEVKPNEMGLPEAVSYSGPTYIAIRSGKRSSPTATSHAQDLETLLTLEPFYKFMKNGDGKVKPVLIISSDGGPDENPRYRKVIAHARRMAPLSRELTGVVLPHDSFGTHLDSNGRTVDVSLEKDNLKKAGEILAEIWSAVCIDGHEVVKCDYRDCCSPRRSALHMILHDRFLSPPYPITQVDGHLTIPDPEEHDGKSFAPFLIRHCLPIQPLHAFIGMPYDLYCPSVRRDLEERCCSTCGIYFSSITRAAEHRRAVHRAPAALARKVRPSRIVTRRATDLLCASDNGLEWLNRNEVEGADDFTENHMDMLVPVVTLETVHESPWTELE